MHIAYDHQIFGWQAYGGIPRYFYEIATRIHRNRWHDVTVVAPIYFNRYLRDNPGVPIVGHYVPRVRGAGRALQKLNAGLVKRVLRRLAPDVVHETYYYEKRLAPPKARTVVTIHDMIYEKFPESYRPNDKTRHLKRQAVARADHIICVSENTRRDLIEILGVEPARTSVIHHGYVDLSPWVDASVPFAGRPYLAYVGLRGGYKNFARFLRAFAASARLRDEFRIVCFGGGQLSATERRLITSLGLGADAVIQVGGDDRVLANVYKHASAFVYPSLYEGFGMPPLEAMALGCPVLCSNTSALPEVCADAVEYFDPADEDAIRAALEAVTGSDERRRQLIEAGQRHLAQFSWDLCARQTADLYSELC